MNLLLILGGLAVVVVATGIVVQYYRTRNTQPAGKNGRTPEPAGKKGKVERTRQPYRYADNAGLLIHGDSVWGVYSMQSITDDLRSDNQLGGLTAQQADDLIALGRNRKPIDCHLIGTRQPLDVDQWKTSVIAHAPNPSTGYRQLVDRWADRLRGMGTAIPAAYLAVKLGTLSGGSRIDAVPLDHTVAPQSTPRAADAIAAGALVGVTDEDFTPEQLGAWQAVADQIPYLLPSWHLSPAARTDIVWLIREPWFGHLPVPTEPDMGSRAWGPGEFDLALETSGYNRHSHIQLDPTIVDGTAGRSYTATLVVTSWPESLRFARVNAWIREAMATGQDVRVSYRFRLIPPDTFGAQIIKATKDLTDEVNDLATALRGRQNRPDAAPEQIVPAKMLGQLTDGQQLLDAVQEGKLPGVEGQPRFSVSAPSLAELRARIAELIRRLGQMNVTVVAPTKAQYRLMEERLLGDPPKGFTLGTKMWGRITNVETVTGGMAAAAAEVGDVVELGPDGRLHGWIGLPIAWSEATGQPVFFTPRNQIVRNRAAGIAVVGASGSGKSNISMLIFYQETEAGVRGYALDPKGDIAQFCYYLAFGNQMVHPQFNRDAQAGLLGTPASQFQPINPEFWADTNIVDVLRAHSGALDPFLVTDDVEQGKQLAAAVLQTILAPDWAQVRGPIVTQCLGDVMRAYYADLNALMQRYQAEHPDATAEQLHVDVAQQSLSLPTRPTMWKLYDQVMKRAQPYLNDGTTSDIGESWRTAHALMIDLAGDGESNKGAPIARLLFARNADSRGILASRRHRRTVYRISGLQVPQATKTPIEQWKPEHRYAAAAMYLITAVITAMVKDDTKEPKLTLTDELHAVTSMEDGRAMIADNLRTGRSQHFAVMVISQQPNDLKTLNSAAEADGTSTNQIPTEFAFEQSTDTEARDMANLLEPSGSDNPVLLRALQSLRTGHAVFRDAARTDNADRRVARIRIDLGFEELMRAADTNPDTADASHSIPISPNPRDWEALPGPSGYIPELGSVDAADDAA